MFFLNLLLIIAKYVGFSFKKKDFILVYNQI